MKVSLDTWEKKPATEVQTGSLPKGDAYFDGHGLVIVEGNNLHFVKPVQGNVTSLEMYGNVSELAEELGAKRCDSIYYPEVVV